ncbi:hypothetical protein JL09_g3567 [Pichia kudriavzevii]|uniref:Protein GMH1 n=1 Tax=Pichia kudriavzevii TaxID=4909 RepID=A0A099NZ23_PICKU|nr:hypothetical protein JL09_g3567 [Pichia kudriavzevii]
MSRNSEYSNPILPLTSDDIIGQPRHFNETHSVTGSIESQSTIPSVSTYAQRSSHRSRMRKIRENFNHRFTVPKYFRRMMVFGSLDFETAFWEMMNLIQNPKRVYKALYYQKQTKNKWARDDPSFVLILGFLLSISAVFWGLMYTTGIFGSTEADFIHDARSMYDPNNSNFLSKYFVFDSILEWSYCFDIHCNAYLMIWLCLYFVQFFCLPLLRMNNFLSTLVGNTLYFFALSYYFLITFYGYNALPFLQKTEYLLSPIIGFVAAWLVLSLSGFNVANYMCSAYFS